MASVSIVFGLGKPSIGQQPESKPKGQSESAATNSKKDFQMPTVAEYSEYKDTATGAQVEAYLRRLSTLWPEAELTTIGRTVEGRPIWALLVAPKERTEVEPLTVLLLGGIHSGECDGKEALLALARDMASGEQGDWWHSLRLIIVPNFNADGNERRGREHRPGQAGPELGMGIRENAQGLDLNRDFVKLETPEVRSLVATLEEYDVDVLIDTHTTNGSLHQYQLTYDIPHTPTTPKAIDSWLRNSLMPKVTNRLLKEGINTFYYGNFSRTHRRWSTYGHEPRYSTEYMGLRGKIGILSESYSYADYPTRIKASYHFVKEVLAGLVEEEATVRKIIDTAKTSASEGVELSVRGTISETADGVVLGGFETDQGELPTPPYSNESLRTHTKKDYIVQFWNQGESTKSVTLPKYYAIPRQYAWAANRLQRHGVVVHTVAQEQEADVESYEVTQTETAAEFQGHKMRSVEVEKSTGKAVLSGELIVSVRQPLGILASYLLEPESDDSLVKWNFFDPDIQVGATYPVRRITSEIETESLVPLEGSLASEQISLEHLFEPGKSVAYGGETIRGAKWLKDSNEYVITGGYGRTYAVDAATGSRRRLTELDSLRSKLASLEAFTNEEARDAATIGSFTDDWAYALLTHNDDLYYFDSESDTVRQLTHSPDKKERLAELSPTGKQVAFVYENNLWVVDCESTELKQLTKDGTVEVLNGILDWVYQEELYGRGNFKGFWWSPDGKRIAFLRLDQTPVPSYQVSDSISYGQSLEATRYPKAGQPLPTVDVWLADLESGSMTKVDLDAWGENDRLVGRVTWSPEAELWLQVFNRVQNKQDLVRVNGANGATDVLFSEASPGWIEIRGTPEFLPDGDFLWLSDLPEGRTHLYKVSAKSGQRSQLTSGDWDVDSLLSVSADHKTAFVSGNISHPTESQLIAVAIESGVATQVTSAPGSHRVNLSASGEYFIDVFSSTFSQPFATLHTINGDHIRAIEVPVSDRHDFLDIQPPRSFAVKTKDGVELQSQLLLPNGVDPAKPETKLPVIFHVYGGPQAPTVRNSWGGRNYWWHQMLAQQGFAVVLCDNRAARGRGVKDTWTIRGDMCRVELKDLEEAVAWVKQQPWADAERIGLWGWSYGGYFTSYALTHSDSFTCGIAGAPVTDWRNYDAIYTERYMDLPQVNEAGYDSSSVVKAAENLSGKLMIIHGERDDNVHMSNTLQLVYALQKAGKQFELMIYPKNRHGIVDPDQRYHMHRMMTEFFKRHLGE